jgi:hypothetical protein
MVFKNTTTIESDDYDLRKRESKKKKIKFLYPYDLGKKKNFKYIFGRNFKDWFFPSFPSTKKLNKIYLSNEYSLYFSNEENI